MTASRVAGLDHWRAALLLGGILFHGTVFKESNLLFDLVQAMSTAFRMAAFFAIAGFLAAVSLRGRPARHWLKTRSIRIGIPALFGVTVIAPLIWTMLKQGLPANHWAHVLPFEWHHLWFLFALLLYQCAAYLLYIHLPLRRARRGLAVLRQAGQSRVMLWLTALTAVLMLSALMVVKQCAPLAYRPMLLHVQLIAGYLPLYLFGMALAQSPALRDAMLAKTRLPATILIVAATVYLIWRVAIFPAMAIDEAIAMDKGLRMMLGTLCPPPAILLIFRSALSVRRFAPVAQRLCEASFTLYVIHYPMLVATNLLALKLEWHPVLEYLVAILAVGALAYAFHYLVVRKSPALGLLLSGRVPGRSALAVGQASRSQAG